MFDADERVLSRLSKNPLPPLGQRYVLHAVASGPSRKVRATPYSSSARFPSRKMGSILETESLTVEFPFFLTWETDHDVLGVYPQPPSIQLDYTDPASGRRVVRRITPDALVVREATVEIVEFKPFEELVRRSAAQPHLWKVDGLNANFAPLTAWGKPRGIVSRVLHPGLLNPIRTANLRSLYPFRDRPPNEEELIQLTLIRPALTELSFIPLADCRDVLGLELDIIWRLVAWEELFVNLDDALLANQIDSYLCASAHVVQWLKTASTLPGHAIPHLAPPPHREFPTSVAHLSRKELQHAFARLARADELLAGTAPVGGTTDRRLMALRRKHLANGPEAILAFAPRWRLCGSTALHTTETEEALIQRHLAMRMDPRCLDIRAAHNSYSDEAKEQGMTPISYETFRIRAASVDRATLEKARGGVRAHTRAMNPTAIEHVELPPGDPWGRAHADSTELDLVLKDSSATLVLGKILVTKMVSSCTRFPLAWVPHFLPTSAEVITMLFRDCVRRWQRLPWELFVDAGGENRASVFDSVAARFGCMKVVHPVGNPKTGAEIESTFKSDAELFLYDQYGNTLNNKRGRAASTSAKAEANAWLRTDQLIRGMEKFLFEVMTTRPFTSNSSLTPREAFERGLARNPCPDGARIAYDSDLLARTAIPVLRDHKVHLGKGIRYKNRWYWNDALQHAAARGQFVEIRTEPHDRTLIYAHVSGALVTCANRRHVLSRHLSDFARQVDALDHELAEAQIEARRREHDVSLAKFQREFALSVAEENGASSPAEAKRLGLVPPNATEDLTPTAPADDAIESVEPAPDMP